MESGRARQFDSEVNRLLLDAFLRGSTGRRSGAARLGVADCLRPSIGPSVDMEVTDLHGIQSVGVSETVADKLLAYLQLLLEV